MGLGSFFRGAWDKVKKVGGKIGGAIKNGARVVGRIAKPVANIISGVSGFLAGAPGKIGQIAGVVRKGIDGARKLIDLLPDSKFKTKLEEGSDKADDIVNKGEKFVSHYADKGKEYTPFLDRVSDVVQKGGDAINKSVLYIDYEILFLWK